MPNKTIAWLQAASRDRYPETELGGDLDLQILHWVQNTDHLASRVSDAFDSATAAWTLVYFGERAASLALRNGDRVWIAAGLTACGLALEILDIKDVLPVVAVLCDAGDRLHLPSGSITNVALACSNPESRRHIRAMCDRPPMLRRIDHMGYSLRHDHGKPIYMRLW